MVKTIRVVIYLVTLFCFQRNGQYVESAISCLDEHGTPVDWFIVYKLPAIMKNSNSKIQDGVGHYYMDNRTPRWRLSGERMDDKSHAVAKTLTQIYDNHNSQDIIYMLYNDHWPEEKKPTNRGHVKGDFCFDRNTGFWLIHSVPRFPNKTSQSYYWPTNAKVNGQIFMCVTYGFNQLDNIVTQLKYSWPWVYDSNIPQVFPKKTRQCLQELVNGKHYTTPNITNKIDLMSNGGKRFHSFAKTAEYGKDIYSKWLTAAFGASLYVQTWQSGTKKLPSICENSVRCKNVKQITLPDAQFRSTKDHSKWAVTDNKDKPWVCVGDLNRMESQKRRGGGVVCIHNRAVWRQFKNVITQSEDCP